MGYVDSNTRAAERRNTRRENAASRYKTKTDYSRPGYQTDRYDIYGNEKNYNGSSASYGPDSQDEKFERADQEAAYRARLRALGMPVRYANSGVDPTTMSLEQWMSISYGNAAPEDWEGRWREANGEGWAQLSGTPELLTAESSERDQQRRRDQVYGDWLRKNTDQTHAPSLRGLEGRKMGLLSGSFGSRSGPSRPQPAPASNWVSPSRATGSKPPTASAPAAGGGGWQSPSRMTGSGVERPGEIRPTSPVGFGGAQLALAGSSVGAGVRPAERGAAQQSGAQQGAAQQSFSMRLDKKRWGQGVKSW